MKKLIVLWTMAAALFAGVTMLSFSPQAKAVLPTGGNGEACSVDFVKMYPLTNTINPGEMGLQSHISCNAPVTISGSASLLQYWPWGWLLLANTTYIKSKSGLLALSMVQWFSCGSLSSLSSNEYKGVTGWDVKFADGYHLTVGQTQTYSNEIFTRCMSPGIAAEG
jgi:hypothetical protein